MSTKVAVAVPLSPMSDAKQSKSAPASEVPVIKRQSKWTTEEDALIIELRGGGMKWEDISRHLPGRSAISCRLHYQNYLERRSEWDEDRKNKLARLYERFKAEMWAKVADELAIPWRAAEAMHWHLGENEMARRAGVVPFSLAAAHDGAMRRSPNRRPSFSNSAQYLPRERLQQSPRPHIASAHTGPTAGGLGIESRGTVVSPPAQSSIPHLSPGSLPPRQHIPPTLTGPPSITNLHHALPPSAMAHLGPSAVLSQQHAPPPPSHPVHNQPHQTRNDYGEPYYTTAPSGPRPMHGQQRLREPGVLLPSVAELTNGMNPYGPAPSPPVARPRPEYLNSPPYYQYPQYLPAQIDYAPQENPRPKRRASQDLGQDEPNHRRRI